jgi:uncharacterized protein (TIGR02646 family)
MQQQHQHKFDRTVYSAKAVKDRLIEIFHNKCAFCECNTSAGAAYDVEHFRPKIHYYWLCYEWTNLLLSCQTCNEAYKKAQFPLEIEANRRHTHPTTAKNAFDKTACHIFSDFLKIEKPYLLHPAIDDPREHLQFLKDGRVIGLTLKGEISIEVYGLDRLTLRQGRKNIILTIQEDILSEYEVNPLPSESRIKMEVKKILAKLIKQMDDHQPFTGFRRTLLENFEVFVIENEDLGYPLPNQNIMKTAFHEFFGRL